MSTVNIVVAGATGKLGKLITESLIERAKAAGQPIRVIGLERARGANSTKTITTSSSEQQFIIEPVDYNNEDDLKRVTQGAYSIVSALQGVEDVIVGVQSRLLSAAIANHVRRFIPSDYSLDIFKIPRGSNRNFDIRLKFHDVASQLVTETKSNIEITSIFQGAFTELLAGGRIIFDYKKRTASYFGSPDTKMEFTTWKNTAQYTAAAALDQNSTPSKLCIAGMRLSPKEAQQIANKVTGVNFRLKPLMSIGMLQRVIGILKFFAPGKNSTMPIWVKMQYAYCMAIGPSLPEQLDNSRYQGIHWSGIEDVVLQAYHSATK